MIYFKLYSLSTTYIYNLKIPKYSPKEKNIYIPHAYKGFVLLQNPFRVTQKKYLENCSSKTLCWNKKLAHSYINMYRGSDKNKHMDWTDENREYNCFPVAELKEIEVIRSQCYLAKWSHNF